MRSPPKISLAQKLTWGDRPRFLDMSPVTDKICTPRFEFQILPIPGHAEDMIALYEPNQGWLFSADLYINSYIDYFLYNESMLNQIQSIEKILALDFEVLFCSHNPKLQRGMRQLEKKLNYLNSFYESVSILYNKGYSINEIFQEMKLKENLFVSILSCGFLSKRNMVKAAIQDLASSG